MRAKKSGQSALLLLDVIDILNDLRIPYAVIGAFAASFHGVIRASMDADAMISLPSGELAIRILTEKLHKAGFKSVYRKGDLNDPIGAVLNVEDRFKNRVDLLTNIRGVEEEVFSRTIQVKFIDARIRVVGLEDFIAMKIFAGNPQDLSDASGALKISRQKVDLTLLKELVRRYGKSALHKLESLLRETAS